MFGIDFSIFIQIYFFEKLLSHVFRRLVDATIYCEKASHKGILIGKNGAMLRKIGSEAREDMEAFLGARVFLQTWIKVKENWRDSEMMLRNFGYRND